MTTADTVRQAGWDDGNSDGLVALETGATIDDVYEHQSGPLSGEWAGMSIPEIFRELVDDWDELDPDEQDRYCDIYEGAYWDGLERILQ
jgi:hypothetical protein